MIFSGLSFGLAHQKARITKDLANNYSQMQFLDKDGYSFNYMCSSVGYKNY